VACGIAGSDIADFRKLMVFDKDKSSYIPASVDGV
jgi:hypothetical protein